MKTGQSALAVRAVVAIYREFEQIARQSDISMAQYRLLLYLRNGPRRAGAIAAAAELAKPTVSLAIKSLRDKGWVDTAPDPDGRASTVVLTPTGNERMAGFERDLIGALEGMLSPEDLNSFFVAMANAYVALDNNKDDRLKAVEEALTQGATR